MIDMETYHAVLLTLMMLESLALLVVAKLLIEWFVVGIEPSGSDQTLPKQGAMILALCRPKVSFVVAYRFSFAATMRRDE